jgi:tRNA(Phe) wybutosine-synthesizing methylase Tyw3
LQACENALLCLKRDIANPQVDEFLENVQVLEKIKRLKDFAMTSTASCSGKSSLFV